MVGTVPHPFHTLTIILSPVNKLFFLSASQETAYCTDCVRRRRGYQDIEKELATTLFNFDFFTQLSYEMRKLGEPLALIRDLENGHADYCPEP
jgi:hypothetical protein